MQKILVTGSSGLLGSALIPRLTRAGLGVVRLVRRAPRAADERRWDPSGQALDADALQGVQAVVHLAGEGIANGRWSRARKRRIRESRVRGTGLLARALAARPAESRPSTLVCASAIGIYGDRGEESLDERSAPGQGFMARVCQDWEAAADPAREAGLRVVSLRLGVVLSPRGGALARMLPPFRMGLAGRLGTGRQWMSWISLVDAVGILCHALEAGELAGPVNTVAPEAVTNAEFTAALGHTLHRPTVLPLPAFAARLALGEMANELLLASTRVQPAALQASGYRFEHPGLRGALANMLGKPTT